MSFREIYHLCYPAYFFRARMYYHFTSPASIPMPWGARQAGGGRLGQAATVYDALSRLLRQREPPIERPFIFSAYRAVNASSAGLLIAAIARASNRRLFIP